MTREEAIEILENGGWWDLLIPVTTIEGRDEEDKLHEAIDLAIAALRPVSREQVETVYPGCDFCKKELDDYPYIVAYGDYSSSDTCYEPGWCPICGRPLTDEAVQMVMERLEALYE